MSTTVEYWRVLEEKDRLQARVAQLEAEVRRLRGARRIPRMRGW